MEGVGRIVKQTTTGTRVACITCSNARGKKCVNPFEKWSNELRQRLEGVKIRVAASCPRGPAAFFSPFPKARGGSFYLTFRPPPRSSTFPLDFRPFDRRVPSRSWNSTFLSTPIEIGQGTFFQRTRRTLSCTQTRKSTFISGT